MGRYLYNIAGPGIANNWWMTRRYLEVPVPSLTHPITRRKTQISVSSCGVQTASGCMHINEYIYIYIYICIEMMNIRVVPIHFWCCNTLGTAVSSGASQVNMFVLSTFTTNDIKKNLECKAINKTAVCHMWVGRSCLGYCGVKVMWKSYDWYYHETVMCRTLHIFLMASERLETTLL